MAVALWPVLIAQQQLGGSAHVCFTYEAATEASYGGALEGSTYAGTASQTFPYGGEC